MIKRVQLSNFRGLDTSSSIYEVIPNRATEMSNIINKDGSNRKRAGAMAIAQFDGKINGMWSFKENGESIIIVHAGSKIYRVKEGVNLTDTVTTEIALPSGSENKIANSRSYGVDNRGVFHIFCGDYLMYMKIESSNYKLITVVDNAEYTYVPTTTVSIDSEGSPEKVRSNFEEANLINIWRVNTLQGVSASAEDSESMRTYYLDSSIMANQALTVTIVSNIGDKIFICKAGENLLRDSNGTAKGSVVHYVGKIIFSNIEDIRASGFDSNNISVKFAHPRDNSVNVNAICNARLGVQFGLNGHNDRLFIAYSNADYYSGSNNYSYFPEYGNTIFGSSMSAITGYSRIADGTLGVHKADGDTSGIYYRSSKTDSYVDEDSGSTISKVVFPITAGALGQYCISSDTCKALDGDTLFLSTNGVYSVTLGSSVVSNERYAKERSQNIANTITKISGLASASAEVIDSRYHLFCGSSCYVADSRFKFRSDEVKEDTFNYEWYKLDYPFMVTCTLFVNNRLYMAGSVIDSSRPIDSGGHCIYVEHPLKCDVLPCNKDSTFTLSKSSNSIVTDMDTLYWLFGTKAERKVMIYAKNIIEASGDYRYDLIHKVLTARKVDSQYFKLYKGTSEVTIDSAESGVMFAIVNNVHSKFVTPLIDLGSNEYLKTIHGIGAVIDNTQLNCVDITCVSTQGEVTASIIQGGTFDFNNVDFNMFVFGTTAFTTVQLHKFRQRNINYLKFIFDSDNDSESIVNNMSIDYSYTKKITRGGNY